MNCLEKGFLEDCEDFFVNYYTNTEKEDYDDNAIDYFDYNYMGDNKQGASGGRKKNLPPGGAPGEGSKVKRAGKMAATRQKRQAGRDMSNDEYYYYEYYDYENETDVSTTTTKRPPRVMRPPAEAAPQRPLWPEEEEGVDGDRGIRPTPNTPNKATTMKAITTTPEPQVGIYIQFIPISGRVLHR